MNRNIEREGYYKIAALVAMVLAISLLHYITPKEEPLYHDVYRRLYYFPVALAGIWFGVWGALAAASAVFVLYMPHVFMAWNDRGRELANRLMDLFLLYCLASVTGFSADVERRLRVKYKDASKLVKESYDKLRTQADLLFETEEMLRRADRLTVVGQMTADFAHEIRTPLSSIKGAAEIIRDGVKADDPKAEFFDIIANETLQLNRVVEDYLSIARSERESDSRESTDLAALVRETALMLKSQLAKHTVTISLNVPEKLVVSGAPGRIKQVLLNLMINAVQAVGDGGRVDVYLSKAQRSIPGPDKREHAQEVAVMRVEDNGPGFTEEALSRLFQPFFTTKAEGTGLGLAVSRRIVAALDGALEGENLPEGGARLTLTLPLNTPYERD